MSGGRAVRTVAEYIVQGRYGEEAILRERPERHASSRTERSLPDMPSTVSPVTPGVIAPLSA
jgi:hypothetical protein